MSIVDAQGAVVGSYEYDPYGNVISATGTLAEINPIRYRGYYFDSESGLYYLQSRYYDPELGRFLNADSFASTGQGILGNNMFAYCNNTPIVSIDPTGHSLHHIFAYIFHEYSGGYSYIIDQTESEIGKKKLGVTTISHGGCGVVATYNALLSMGDYRSFDDVLAYYNEHFSRLTFGGLAGIMPGEVAQYFENNGYRTYMTDNPSEIDALSQTADACILWYMFPATYYPLGVKVDAFGAHFVEYSKEATAYIGRNTAEGSGTYYFTWPSDYGYKGQRYYAIGIFVYELGG